MTAMDQHIRLELTIPGDAGHVAARSADAINALVAIGFRLALKLDGPTYLMQDHEAPVDSTTMDETNPMARLLRRGVPPRFLPGTGGDDAGVPDRFSTGAVTPVPATEDDPGTGPVMLAGVCGMAVCGHDAAQHKHAGRSAVAGQTAARRPGAFCSYEVAPGLACSCPGFTPVTGNLLTDEGQAMLRQNKPGPY